jgi:glycine cleavage system aminomethyltransferase T
LGWEIYAPTEFGRHLWDVLWEAAESHGVVAGGGGAFDSLRLEKGYRLWGNDIHTDYNPFEAGLGWAVRLDKSEFIGRQALLESQERDPSKKLCAMTFDTPEGMALGKEPVLQGDRKLGYVTSANYGYSISKFILYAYLPMEYAEAGTQVEVEYFGKRYPATVVEEPLFDPEMRKIKI